MGKNETKSVRIIGRAVTRHLVRVPRGPTLSLALTRFVGETPAELYRLRGRIAPMRRLLALTSAIVLVDTILYGTLTPLVPYFSEEFGLSKSAVGILSGAFGAGVLVGSAPGAYLASRAGVRAAAITGLVLMSVTSLAFGLAEAAWVLVLARFVGGFGSSLSWVAAFAAVGAAGIGISLWAAVESAPGPAERRPLLGTLRALLRPRLATGLWL